MKPARVLIIDDDSAMVNFISALVHDMNCHPTSSFDIENGLGGFRTGFYHLVIVDIFMEGVGGIEGIQRIRAIDPHVPIIAISAGYGNISPEKAILAAQKVGASYTLAKPFSPEALAGVIRQALGTAE